MNIYEVFLLSLTTIILVRQDARELKVSVWAMVLFVLTQISFWIIRLVRFDLILMDTLANLITYLLMILCLSVYVKFRFGKKAKLDNFFGSGDILFLFALCFGLSFSYYLATILVSSVSGAIFVFLKFRDDDFKRIRVPFISFVGVFYLFFIILAQLKVIPSLLSNWI